MWKGEGQSMKGQNKCISKDKKYKFDTNTSIRESVCVWEREKDLVFIRKEITLSGKCQRVQLVTERREIVEHKYKEE